jgi:hypothetical protein
MNENKPFATVGILLTIKGMMIEVQNGLWIHRNIV